ncbi:MAG: ribosomal protein S18-alanine N-acetyltransferase [Gemmatimonadota bacterium]
MERVGAPGDVAVRRLVAEDVDAVAAIESEAFTSPWSRQTFLDLADRPNLELLVLEHRDEGVIGYAVLWCIMDQGELANVAVSPRYRGRGLGTFLLSSVLDIARSRGIETLFLEVRVSNERALELYERLGFSDVGLRRGYYDDPKEDARIMKVTLA